MKPIREKRKSILHVQNVFLSHPISIYLARETPKYFVGYELKQYRIHHLLYKISKDLLGKVENPINVSRAVDLNVREEFRYSIKKNDPDSRINGKNVTIRIIPTRYYNIPPLYATIFNFKWRHTNAGGLDQLNFKIAECPIIVNSNTIGNICYKKVAHQVSSGGTHGTHTYLLVSPRKGEYMVGEWIHYGNVNRGGHQHGEIRPFSLSL